MSIDMDKRSKVVNLCNWSVSFTLPNSHAEVILGAKKSATVNNGELVTLCDNQDVMFYGTGHGDHARIYIENAQLRQHVGFDNAENKAAQFVLTLDECKKLFDLKTDSAFEKRVKEKIIMYHEKDIIMNYARSIRCNDYSKIKFLEEYTGIMF